MLLQNFHFAQSMWFTGMCTLVWKVEQIEYVNEAMRLKPLLEEFTAKDVLLL